MARMNAEELRSLMLWRMLQGVADKDIEVLAGIDGATDAEKNDVVASINRCLRLDTVPESFSWDALQVFQMGCSFSGELSDSLLYYGCLDAAIKEEARRVMAAFWCLLVHNSLHEAKDFPIEANILLYLIKGAFVLGFDWLMSVHQMLLVIADKRAVHSVHPAVISAALGLASLLLGIVSFRESCARLYASSAVDSSMDEAQELQLDLVRYKSSPAYLLRKRGGWPSELRNAQRVADAAAVLAQQIGDAFASDLRNA